MARYLASGMGTAICATSAAEAAVVTVDLSAIPTTSPGQQPGLNGLNAGLGSNAYKQVYFPGPSAGYKMFALNRFGSPDPITGLNSGNDGSGRMLYFGVFASAYTSPKKFGAGALIDGAAATWTNNGYYSSFQVGGLQASDFGANSYLGFRLTPNTSASPQTYYYGYFQTLWDTTTGNFQLLSAAYESTPNTGIMTPAAVPEPSTLTLTGIGALAMGAGAIRRSRRARKDSQAAAP